MISIDILDKPAFSFFFLTNTTNNNCLGRKDRRISDNLVGWRVFKKMQRLQK